jgi:hypothetical protein
MDDGQKAADDGNRVMDDGQGVMDDGCRVMIGKGSWMMQTRSWMIRTGSWMMAKGSPIMRKWSCVLRAALIFSAFLGLILGGRKHGAGWAFQSVVMWPAQENSEIGRNGVPTQKWNQLFHGS